ncbi:MAG: ATP-binding protein [Gammaproteobacteria bacterium]|nr:ATP-binding protein [Gammaproteobacteria bacterium]
MTTPADIVAVSVDTTGNDALSSVKAADLDAEVVKLFQQQLKPLVGGNIIVSLFTGFVFWNVAPAPHVILWVTAIFTLALIRFLHARNIPVHEKLLGNTRYWKNSFILFSSISGILWGSSVFLLPESNQLYIIFITLILLGMVAASITSLTLILPAYYAYAIFTIAPLAIMFFLLGGEVFNILGTASIAFVISVMLFSRYIHKSYIESLRLRYENIELVERLSAEKERAEKANIEKSRFLASASHDLRQPLHALGLFLGSMKPYLDNDESKDLLKKSSLSLQALHELFDALLDISKLDAGIIQVNQYNFPISEILNNLETEFLPQAKNKGITLSFSNEDFSVLSDPVLITRCLRNLVSNALQHSESGEIVITCEKLTKDLRIKVTDTGPGIAESDIDRIFKEFEQLHNPERDRRKGLGLGLTIVKRLCDLMKCEINVKSEPGVGSCFYMDIPLGNKEDTIHVSYDSSEPTPIDPKQASILVIDDEVEILDAINSLLSQWGHQVRTCASVSEAEAILNEGFIPELIISDYRLRAHQTGIDAIEKINHLLTGIVPAVLITGDTSPERLREARASGYPLIHKPVRPAMLRATLSQLLRKRA